MVCPVLMMAILVAGVVGVAGGQLDLFNLHPSNEVIALQEVDTPECEQRVRFFCGSTPTTGVHNVPTCRRKVAAALCANGGLFSELSSMQELGENPELGEDQGVCTSLYQQWQSDCHNGGGDLPGSPDHAEAAEPNCTAVEVRFRSCPFLAWK